jgi:predicted MFS family arabinose efflux permease
MKGLVGVGKDIWHLAQSKPGLLALILCFLPIGSGAASGLWSAVAGDWQASANTVALATGVVSGVITAGGCLIGGWICDRMDRKNAYMLFGVAQGLAAVAMALLPHSEFWYIVMTSVYSLVTGLTYAGFTAFVLEAMGLGAAATKFSLYASLSNAPIAYMTSVDGWAHGRFGASGMLYAEAIAGTIGLLCFVMVRATVKRGALGARLLREHI